MPVFMANEVWQEVKRYVQQQDRADAADALVSVLIDNDCDADDIKSVFKSDSAVKSALAHYIKDHQDEEDDDGSESD